MLHVTMHYFPIKGGQEVYIEELNKILKNLFDDIEVIQPSKYNIGNTPDNVHLTPRLSIVPRFIKDIDWVWFNIMVKLFYSKKIKNSELVITHYPLHFPATRDNSKNIIVSHGIDWVTPPKTYVDRMRRKYAKNILGKAVIVANDTDFLRFIGLDINPSQLEFNEICKNVWYIPNCVDCEFYYKNTSIKKENIILVPRNIRHARGIHLAIEIFNEIYKIDTKYEMYITGGPLSGAYYNYCINLIKQYNLDSKILFLGSKNKIELRELYFKSICTLIPTISQEGTSLSALESMATGTMTFSTKIGGLLDLPTEKISNIPSIAAKEIVVAMKNYKEISLTQYIKTVDTFNMANWKKAWNNVIEKVFYDEQ